MQKRGDLLEKLLLKYYSIATEADAALCRTVTAGAASHRLMLETIGVKIGRCFNSTVIMNVYIVLIRHYSHRRGSCRILRISYSLRVDFYSRRAHLDR